MILPYALLYFSSAVLADRRVVVMGGEYNYGEEAWKPVAVTVAAP